MALIEAHQLTRILPGDIPVTLVKNIDAGIEAGEFVAITGPSGSGKSSLLYLLGLLDRPTSGDVLIDGQSISTLNEEQRAHVRLKNLGFVFQFHFLLPEFSAIENVMMPMRRLGERSENEMVLRATNLLETLGLGGHLYKRPRQLSGGQSQRVAIARALANDPKIILADEPTGNLDSAASQLVQGIFRDLAHNQKRAVAVVTHEVDFVSKTDRVIRLVDGCILQNSQN
ncbi:MAG: ABC transporter ATP-binding protein [Pseudomonadota bacterium]